MKKAKFRSVLLLTFAFIFIFFSCSGNNPAKASGLYRSYYEIFVGSFYDSDNDGTGDLRGLIEKLDYLAGSKNSLGINGIWLMPIMPSPTYHKYDAADYYSIDPAYGTMDDFTALIEECDKRGVDVIIDLMLNHTSVEHPWFVKAKEEVNSGNLGYYASFYNIADHKVDSNYYPLANGYYYQGVFWSGMPDLNYDNPEVREEMANVVSFWFNKGVAGFRLDACTSVYTFTEQNIEFWTWFCNMAHGIKPDAYLIGEVWEQDNEIFKYYNAGFDSLFSFGFAGTDGIINKTVSAGNGETLARNIARFEVLMRNNNENGINAPFLSNHDTDRSAGYINSLEEQKLQAAVYLLMPGNSFTYYGEEIGLLGRGVDENKRTAMIWSSSDKTGIAKPPNGAANNTPSSGGVAEQLADENSLLNYYRSVLALKNKYPAIQEGKPEAVYITKAVCSYMIGDYAVVHNLSVETAEVPLAKTKLSGYRIAGSVSPDGSAVKVSKNTITIPPYSSAILKR